METIKLYGKESDTNYTRVKEFLVKNQIHYENGIEDFNSSTGKIDVVQTSVTMLVINNEAFVNPSNYELSKNLGINKEGRLIFFGADWCPDCRKLKRFLIDNQLNFMFLDVDADPERSELVIYLNQGKRIIPTVLIDFIPYSNPKVELIINHFKLINPIVNSEIETEKLTGDPNAHACDSTGCSIG